MTALIVLAGLCCLPFVLGGIHRANERLHGLPPGRWQ